MGVEFADIGEATRKLLEGWHLFVRDACPAEMNGQVGFLGMSRGVYWRIWFDTEGSSKTLFSSFKRTAAEKKYQELRSAYGQVSS